MPISIKKYQKMVSKWSQNPWKIGPGTQQKTKLKNRASKIKKYSKNDPKMDPKKWRHFGGNPSWRTFGGPNRFCDQKVGPQCCQSAPKTRKMSQKWHKRAPRMRKWARKVDPFRSQAKMSSKSRLFSEPSETELEKWTLFGARPGGLREALTINQFKPIIN